MRRIAAVLLGVILAGCVPAAAQTAADPAPAPAPRTMMDFYRLASAAEAAGDFAAAADHFGAGLALVPQSPHLLLGAARCALAAGDTAAGLVDLRRLARVGAAVDLQSSEQFAALLAEPGFAAVAAELAANAAPPAPAAVACTLADAQMWTEGIACDLATGDLFAGSVMLGKIVRLRDGKQEEFGTSAQDGLLELLGLDIDEQRRRLWAVTGRDRAEPGAKHDFGEAPRDNMVVVYDLDSGEKTAAYPMTPDDRIHLWNDVTVTPDGTAYFTDLATSEIYRITPGGGPELFYQGLDFQYFNGIAAADDGRLLYAAALEGIVVIGTADGSAALLACPDDLYTGLGDGLALRGRDLYIVQNNGLLNQRILHCRLDRTGRRAVSGEALLCGLPEGLMPYTCALGEDVLYVNGTAPFSRYDDPGPPPAPVIVAIPLGGSG